MIRRMTLMLFILPCLILLSWGEPQPTLTAQHEKIQAKLTQLRSLGLDPKIVDAVKSYNTTPPPPLQGMTNEKWKSISMLDPLIKGLIKNRESPLLYQ